MQLRLHSHGPTRPDTCPCAAGTVNAASPGSLISADEYLMSNQVLLQIELPLGQSESLGLSTG